MSGTVRQTLEFRTPKMGKMQPLGIGECGKNRTRENVCNAYVYLCRFMEEGVSTNCASPRCSHMPAICGVIGTPQL